MPSTRSARRAETQQAKKERMQRQRDRVALRMPVPPRPASPIEQDMLSLFGSIMHGVHYATRQAPTVPCTQPEGQWLLTDALYESPDALKPENILPRNDNAGRGRQDHLAQLSGAIADAGRQGVDPQVLFFLDLMVKAEKAVAQAEETRGSPINHLGAYLKALKRDITSWADRKFSEGRSGSDADTTDLRSSNSASAAQLSEPQSVGQTPAAAATSSNAATAQPAAQMLPPPIRPRDAQPQRKTAQPKAKRSLIVCLKAPAFPGGNNPSTGSSTITTAAAQPNLASSDVVTNTSSTTPTSPGIMLRLRPNAGKTKLQQSAGNAPNPSSTVTTARKRKATEAPAITDASASKKTRTSQVATSVTTTNEQTKHAPVRNSSTMASVTMPPQPQANGSSQQAASNNNSNEPRRLRSKPSKATNYAESNASENEGPSKKRKSPVDGDFGNGTVSEQPAKRRRAAAPKSNKATKVTSGATSESAAIAPPAATADASTTTTNAAPVATSSTNATPATTSARPPSTVPTAPQLRQRNGSGPVTGRDGFELIGREPRFTLGQNDAHLLTLHFYRNDDAGNRILDSHTWKGKTDDRTPADIDWTNAKDIKILNKWVLQYLNRTWKVNGLRPDMMARVWMDEEFEWLAHQARHYHSWSKQGKPSLEERCAEFNEEWEGEQIPYMNMAGEEVLTMPRPERTGPAIQSAARRDERIHPARWVGTYLEGSSKRKKSKNNKEEEEEL